VSPIGDSGSQDQQSSGRAVGSHGIAERRFDAHRIGTPFAALHMSVYGTKRRTAMTHQFGRYRSDCVAKPGWFFATGPDLSIDQLVAFSAESV
jgi:hypothetical protein